MDGKWSNWKEWSSCSVTCANGTSKRIRKCNSPSPSAINLDCKEKSSEERLCVLDPCPGNKKNFNFEITEKVLQLTENGKNGHYGAYVIKAVIMVLNQGGEFVFDQNTGDLIVRGRISKQLFATLTCVQVKFLKDTILFKYF